MKTWDDIFDSEEAHEGGEFPLGSKAASEFAKYFYQTPNKSDSSGKALVALTKYSSPVNTLDWSSDGKYVALGTKNGFVMVYEFAKLLSHTPLSPTDQRVRMQAVMEDGSIGREISSVRWHPYEPHLLAATGNDKVHIWNIKLVGGEADACVKVGDMRSTGCMGNIIRWHPSGEHLYVSTHTDSMFLFAVKEQKKLERVAWSELPYRCHDFRVSPDGKRLLVATDAGTVVVYSVVTKPTGNPGINAQHKKRAMQCHSSSIYSVAIEPHGRYFATASSDSVSTFVTLEDFETIGCFARCRDEVRCVSFSHDGELACVVSKTEMYIVHTATRKVIHRQEQLPKGYSYFDVMWHPKRYIVLYCVEERNDVPGFTPSNYYNQCGAHFWVPNAEAKEIQSSRD